MKTIWKYPLALDDHQVIEMPRRAHILLVAHHEGQLAQLCLWAEVHPNAPTSKVHIEIFGTGRPIDEAVRTHLGSVVMPGGHLVVHVFENHSHKQAL